MLDWKPPGISRLTDNLGGVTLRRRAVIDFAHEHKLIYFRSVSGDDQLKIVIRGSTVSHDQMDTNLCIGSHAGYDLAVVERTASVGFASYKTTIHRWYVVQIDLNAASNLPFMFVGTRQQTKAYYARLLTTHRQLRYLALDADVRMSQDFHSHYAILAASNDVSVLHQLLSDTVIETMATHMYPFAVEIQDDTLYVITEASKPSKQLLDKLLHYGLWLAKEIDQRLV